MCVICIIGFCILLVMNLERQFESYLEIRYVFVPIWVMFGTALLLGTVAIVVACISKTEKR